MNLENFIVNAGYVGLTSIIFAESGLLIGFFLPGDSLLFTAGFLASQNVFNIISLCIILPIAAISGDSVGYWFGKTFGKKLFNKEDSLLFHKHHLIAANEFYKKHGGKTIILARFIPAVRTFAPIVAGAADMEYSKFLFFNVTGGLFWTIGLLTLGFFLGKSIPNVDRYLLPIVLMIVIVSVSPGIIHILKDEASRNGAKDLVSKTFNKIFKSKGHANTNNK